MVLFLNPDVYICYSSSDKVTADAICHVLEENKFKCWIKPRDVGIEHVAEVVPQAIRSSRCVVLVFSENAKASNFVNTEVDIAFSSNIPIIVFKIDNSRLDGGLEFFLENKHWLDAYPNPGVEFRHLVLDVAKLLDKPVSDPVISRNVLDSINTYYIDDSGSKSENNKAHTFLGLLGGMCLLPIILVVGGMALNFDEAAGTNVMIIALALFFLTPLAYLIMYFYNK